MHPRHRRRSRRARARTAGWRIRCRPDRPGSAARGAGAGAGVRASVADARELPFADAAFDAALLLGPLYHLASSTDRRAALREAHRVVRTGGHVLAAG
ncbi:methyltransferase domain-containing protein [Microbacterium sp. NPDC058345]|uniref:methyltransferase domain-containing protein n=1 Tax=Microbacterium sp. NPDC058345 TaxID=3346455 RepID=UPI003667757D